MTRAAKEKAEITKFHEYRKDAIRAAIDFGYGEDVIDAINKAATDDDISKIMCKARLRS